MVQLLDSAGRRERGLRPQPVPLKERCGPMVKSVFSKVMWLGRATVFVVGLAVILAMVVGLASTALAANGANFIIGNGLADTLKNIATLPTKLTMQGTNSGPALQLTQQSTNTGASGVGVTVPSGKAPIKVNATAGKATNLNADKLDGLDSADIGRQRWAVIRADSTVVRGSGVVSANTFKLTTGLYQVDFDTNVQNCAYVATTSSGFAGQTGVRESSGRPTAIEVFTTSSAGTTADLP